MVRDYRTHRQALIGVFCWDALRASQASSTTELAAPLPPSLTITLCLLPNLCDSEIGAVKKGGGTAEMSWDVGHIHPHLGMLSEMW